MANEVRLIDANALIATIEKIAREDKNQFFHLDEITQEIFDAPTIDPESLRWISVEDDKPDEFVSVLGHMTDAGDFPAVRECYKVGNVFFFPALQDIYPIDKWAYMPGVADG